MANSKVNSGDRSRYVSIDTAPAAGGYWSDSVGISKVNAGPLFFSFQGGGVATVTIQFQTPAQASWQDYDSPLSLVSGTRAILDDAGFGVKWRAGVKEGAYTSDTIIVGFDW